MSPFKGHIKETTSNRGLRTTQKISPQTFHSDYNDRSYCLEFPLIQLVRTGVCARCLKISLNKIRGWGPSLSGVLLPDGILFVPLYSY